MGSPQKTGPSMAADKAVSNKGEGHSGVDKARDRGRASDIVLDWTATLVFKKSATVLKTLQVECSNTGMEANNQLGGASKHVGVHIDGVALATRKYTRDGRQL